MTGAAVKERGKGGGDEAPPENTGGAPMDGVEWLTWQPHRRTENIASYYGIPVSVVRTRSRGFVRYAHASIATLRYLLRRRPRVLIVQNPSLVLTLLAVLLRPLFRYRLVVDAHNEAVQPFINTHAIMIRLSRWLLRRADLTIVTNQALAEIVRDAGGAAAVLPDRLPDIRPSGTSRSGERVRAVLIATFASDEPVVEVLEAHRRAGRKIDLYVTGKLDGLPAHIREKYSDSVIFTGFLPEDRYCALLEEADFIIDLTLMDNCLVCGAYEAIALGKPVVLSDNKATRAYFHQGVVYVDNTVDGIVSGLGQMLFRHESLALDATRLRDELSGAWPRMADEIKLLMAEADRRRVGDGI